MQSVPIIDAAGAWPAPVMDPGRLLPVMVSTQQIKPRRQFDLWCSKYETFNALRPLDPMVEGFAGRNEIWPFGCMTLMRNAAPAMVFKRNMWHIRRAAVDHWSFA
jgi:hypothetical protein